MSTFMNNWLLRRAMSAPRGSKEYIQFADPAVEAICVANWSSDGIGLTLQDAAAVTTISGFSGNTQITSFDELQYFTGVTSMYEPFFNCNNLASVILPPYLTEITGYCFYGCANGLYAELPDTLQSIANAAFRDILTLVCRATTPPTWADPWAASSGSTIYVPYSADHSILNAYKSATGWAKFANNTYELNPDGTIPT